VRSLSLLVSCLFLLISWALGQSTVMTVAAVDPSEVQTDESTRIVLTGTNLDHVSQVAIVPARVGEKCDNVKLPCPTLEIQSKAPGSLALLVTIVPKTPVGDYVLTLTPDSGFTLDATALSQTVTVSRAAVCSSFSPLEADGFSPVIKTNEVYCSASIVGWREARNAFGVEMANHYIFVEVTVTNLATDRDLFVVGMNVNFGDKFNTDPRDSEVLTESAKRAQTYASRSWIFRGLTFVNGLVGGIASTDFAPDELQIANGQLSAFIPGLDKLWPDHTARELELFIEKTFVRSTAIVRRNNDTHTFEVAIEQRLFLNKDERKQFRKYQPGCPSGATGCNAEAPLIVNLQDKLRIKLVDTGVVGVNEQKVQPAAPGQTPPPPPPTPGSKALAQGGAAAKPTRAVQRAVPLLSPR